MLSPRSLSAIGLVYESQTLSIGLYLFNFLGMFPDHISVSGHEIFSSLPQFTIWPFCEGCLHDHHFSISRQKILPCLSLSPKQSQTFNLFVSKKTRNLEKSTRKKPTYELIYPRGKENHLLHKCPRMGLDIC